EIATLQFAVRDQSASTACRTYLRQFFSCKPVLGWGTEEALGVYARLRGCSFYVTEAQRQGVAMKGRTDRRESVGGRICAGPDHWARMTRAAFTLIELLVVTALIGMLVAL